MICLQTPSFGSSFQDGHQLASEPAHHKQRVARSSPNFSDQCACSISCRSTGGFQATNEKRSKISPSARKKLFFNQRKKA